MLKIITDDATGTGQVLDTDQGYIEFSGTKAECEAWMNGNAELVDLAQTSSQPLLDQ